MTDFEHIFISGATGYIAQHIIFQLLGLGKTVVGSVRSIEKGERLVKLFNNPKFYYEVVPVLEVEGAFDEALKKHTDVTVFLHTASPVEPQADSTTDIEKDILIPAIEGTKFVLESIKQHAPQITRVVYTSSIVACAHPEQLGDPNFTGGESTWTDISYEKSKENPLLGYVGSKTFAEKEAWNFVETQKPNFTLSSIQPLFVLGPQVDPAEAKQLNFSAKIVGNVLKLKLDEVVPAFGGGFIDVRDVAKAHILAFEKSEAQGKRFVLISEFFTTQSVLDLIRKHFPQLQDKLPTGKVGDYDFSKRLSFNDKNARSILKIDYISLEKSVVDAVTQILQ